MQEAFNAEVDRLAPELERLASDPGYVSHAHRHYSYVARGRYAEQLGVWFRHFDRSRLLAIRTETLSSNPDEVRERLFDFLGLRPADIGTVPSLNAAEYETADADLRQWLGEKFAEPNQRLTTLLGPEFTW